jgi:hypothetical protein
VSAPECLHQRVRRVEWTEVVPWGPNGPEISVIRVRWECAAPSCAVRFSAQRPDLFEPLETLRRRTCTYSHDPCDCKYGIERDQRPASEATGCPELREAIGIATGTTPYHSIWNEKGADPR